MTYTLYGSETLHSEAFVRYIKTILPSDKGKTNLVILSGPPYSGKTVFRENFLSLTNGSYQSGERAWWVLSADDIRKNYAEEKGLTYTDTFDKEGKTMIATRFAERIKYLRSKEANIIVDMMNLNARQRKSVITQLGSDKKVTVISFDKPDKKTLSYRVHGRILAQYVSEEFAASAAENQTIPDMETEGIDYFLRADVYGHVYLFTDGKYVLTSDDKGFKTIICRNED